MLVEEPEGVKLKQSEQANTYGGSLRAAGAVSLCYLWPTPMFLAPGFC